LAGSDSSSTVKYSISRPATFPPFSAIASLKPLVIARRVAQGARRAHHPDLAGALRAGSMNKPCAAALDAGQDAPAMPVKILQGHRVDVSLTPLRERRMPLFCGRPLIGLGYAAETLDLSVAVFGSSAKFNRAGTYKVQWT
jgi:hypothetical protein